MIAAMRWVAPGKHNMFVGDRSALFSSLQEHADPTSLWPAKGACLPLEGRLRAILRRLASTWTGECELPFWKNDQIRNPEKWEVRISLEPELKTKRMSKISFYQFGLTGLDVKSHQTNSSYPYPIITKGNDAQDEYRKDSHLRPVPANILIPSGGPFAFLCKDGQ